jgi:hypothetical protein
MGQSVSMVNFSLKIRSYSAALPSLFAISNPSPRLYQLPSGLTTC